MAAIYLARHGRTTWNREEIFRGQTDIPLDDLGRRQAEALGSRLADRGIEMVVFSPLARARETARIAALSFPAADLREEPSFTDLNFGEWEGLSRQQVEERYPELYAQWARAPETVSFPRGESLPALRDRAWEALVRLVRTHPQERILVVTHRVVCKVLLAEAVGAGLKAFWRIRQDTACLNVLHWAREHFELLLLNDTCHLRQLESDRADF